MNWKNRLTNYNFWISIFSAVLLILQALKIEFDIAYVNEIFTAVLGLLVVIGIISDPTRITVKPTEQNSKEENVSQVVAEEKSLPTQEQVEVNNVGVENDFKIILEKISTELNKKFEELEKLNNINLPTEVVQNENMETAVEEQVSTEVITPTVVEMGNPYVDTIN